MRLKLGVVMDPIAAIHFKKDSTLAMLLEAQRREWSLYYMETKDLFAQDGAAWAQMKSLSVFNDATHWFELGQQQTAPLDVLDVILMRKDPPFDMDYIYTTYMLELAEAKGTLIVNKPQSLRDANEKMFTAWFPQCCPATLVTSNSNKLHDFIQKNQDVIVKPLEGMGGASIFRLQRNDPNISVVLEMLTRQGKRYIMAQQFIAEINQGDKRILVIDGKPIPYALARIPAKGELRGNLAAGAKGVGVELTQRDYWICEQVGPRLRDKGLIFVGLDVIGDYLTEINVTSPTCIREIDAAFNLNISAQLLDCVTNYISERN